VHGDNAVGKPFLDDAEETTSTGGKQSVELSKEQIYLSLMQSFGYSPNEIASMTIEQMRLAFKDPDKDCKIVRCSSIQEARKFLQEFKNAKS